MQSAGCGCPGNTVWENSRKRDCHARAFYVGDYCRVYPADHGSAAVWDSGDAFETETDLIPDGIKETKYEAQNEFRNTGIFIYSSEMEEVTTFVLLTAVHYDTCIIWAGDCRRAGRTNGRTAGGDRGQLHRGTKSIHGWLGQRQWWFL